MADLSDFFKSIDLKDSLEISYFFNRMLNEGYYHVHEYKSYFFEYDKWSRELLGSRIMTGHSVCRHNASMLTDLLNEM